MEPSWLLAITTLALLSGLTCGFAILVYVIAHKIRAKYVAPSYLGRLRRAGLLVDDVYEDVFKRNGGLTEYEVASVWGIKDRVDKLVAKSVTDSICVQH